jgi:outer membrane protein OmpA-like peptidoglycan-associated protein
VEVALIGAFMALILLFPATKEMVVILPSADGHVGTVVVERGDERFILNEPYATTRITSDGQVKIEKLEQREVQASVERAAAARPAAEPRAAPPSPFEQAAAFLPAFGGAVSALPPRPASFYLYFITGTDTLTEASKLQFARMLEDLRSRQAPDIVVIGHTDRVGAPETNDELSLQRAERMKADLVAQGVAAPERIRAAGRGEREPVVETVDGVDEPLNRRVEITVR